MATKDFEVQQIVRAYRKGLISEELFASQMAELSAGGSAEGVPNIFTHRGERRYMLGKTAQSESMVINVPAHHRNDRENTHKGDQLIYVVEGHATARVSGQEHEIKAGDFVTIPAGAPHTLRTGDESLFAITIFAPPER